MAVEGLLYPACKASRGERPVRDAPRSGRNGEPATSQRDVAVGLEPIDRVYAWLRLVALAATLGFALISLGPGAERRAVLGALGGFVAYSLLLYLGGWRVLRSSAKARFYIAVAAFDLGFVAVLMALTGGAQSPFYRAFFLWVAMLAFYLGRRGGSAASLAALAVFLAFHVADRFAGDAWLLAAQAGGIVVHGPLIGYLRDRERERAEALRDAGERLAQASRTLVEKQARLVQAEKLSAIGRLAATVAHEINNPLQGARGCLEGLRSGTLAPEKREQYFAAVREALERVRATVQGLLAYAGERALVPAALDPAEVLATALRLLEPALLEKDLRVRLDKVPDGVRVLADHGQLVQALTNVLANAIHALPHGGEISVHARFMPGRVGIAIADNGPGIPTDILGRVCDPFFTTRPEGNGTGLGLAVTLAILRAHGGDLSIDSTEGRGTTVTLWLPGTPAEHTSQPGEVAPRA
jgi:signal transduction histidine kinase